MKINIRPHHLLCIQKFTGHGYSEEFTEHMKMIVSELKKNPEIPVTVAQGCDDLCQRCPNNINSACNSLDKVASMDSAVLDICGLAYGENVSWKKAADNARERIFETKEFHNICSCCQWFDLCRNTEV